MALTHTIIQKIRNLVVGSALTLGITAGIAHADTADNVVSQGVSYVGVKVDANRIINQNLYSSMACGPTSLLNTLRYGPAGYRQIFNDLPGADDKAKLAQFINKYGSMPSVQFPNSTAYANGMHVEDMGNMLNTVLQEGGQQPEVGSFFDRKAGESASDHLRRVHRLVAGSLKKGVPVITAIVAYAARGVGQDISWNEICAHFVVIVRVPAELDATQEGFEFQYIEPDSARLRTGYIRLETQRSFLSLKGDGNHIPWVQDQFLMVEVPDLSLATSGEAWYERTYMMPRWGIGGFATEDVSPTKAQPCEPVKTPQTVIAALKTLQAAVKM